MLVPENTETGGPDGDARGPRRYKPSMNAKSAG